MEGVSRISADEFHQLVSDTIPLARLLRVRVDELGFGVARVTLPGGPEHVRAGGTMSGVSIMALVDTAIYAAVLSRIGLEPMAVTSDISVRFLRRPPIEDLHAEARVLKLGPRQAVAEVRLWSEDIEKLVAHATGTYALPGG
jgi:uncharacterized protein (TIGR00369 family)